MSLIVYCIFLDGHRHGEEKILGIGGREVGILCAGGLCAAVSETDSPTLPLDIPVIAGYQRVVEWFNTVETVIPMRFGCIVEREDLLRRLDADRESYSKTLRELSGCMEMGVRVIMEDEGAVSDAAPGRSGSRASGRAYLELRRRALGLEEARQRAGDRLIGAVRRNFEGRYVECRSEKSRSLLSLYFLVRREDLGAFRAAFRELASDGGMKCLLSGPWPPYNFVSQETGLAAEERA